MGFDGSGTTCLDGSNMNHLSMLVPPWTIIDLHDGSNMNYHSYAWWTIICMMVLSAWHFLLAEKPNYQSYELTTELSIFLTDAKKHKPLKSLCQFCQHFWQAGLVGPEFCSDTNVGFSLCSGILLAGVLCTYFVANWRVNYLVSNWRVSFLVWNWRVSFLVWNWRSKPSQIIGDLFLVELNCKNPSTVFLLFWNQSEFQLGFKIRMKIIDVFGVLTDEDVLKAYN